jgi:lipid A 3-O-deacylase
MNKHIMNSKRRLIIALAIYLFFSSLLLCPGRSLGEETEKGMGDNRYGLGLVFGNSYDPAGDIDFYMLSGSALYDYEKIWHHSAPEPLRFKVECSIGAAREKKMRLMTSLNIFALYYLDVFGDDIKPYIEGGIGIIYTDFKIKGQGLKLNFNPQMGVGMEFNTKSKEAYFLSFRLHHISNGGIDDDNRGINSALMIFGRYF